MFFILVTLVASQTFPSQYSSLTDSCDQPVDTSSSNYKFISFVATASELTEKCSYLKLDQTPVPAGTEDWYVGEGFGSGLLTWPVYKRKDPAVRYVFDCSNSDYAEICSNGAKTLNGDVYYPQNCNWQSGDYLNDCTQRTTVPRPSTWPYDWEQDLMWAGFDGESMDDTTKALLTAKDGISESNMWNYAELRGDVDEDNRKWWAWLHELGFYNDPSVYEKVAAFMDASSGGFFCGTCKTHFTYELAPYLPYTNLQKQNMVLLLWDLHNRANWEIKASKPDQNDWDMYPSPVECSTCRSSSNWKYDEVQKHLYEQYFPGVDVPRCVMFMSDESSCAAGCFFNADWGVCQQEPSCNNPFSWGWSCSEGQTFTLVRDDLGCISSYTCDTDDSTTCASGDVKLVGGTAYVWDAAGGAMSEVCGHWFTDDTSGADIICTTLGYVSGTAARAGNVDSPYPVGNCWGERGANFPDCGTPSGSLDCSGNNPSVTVTCVDSFGAELSALTAASCVEPVTTAEPTTVSTDAYTLLPDYIYGSESDAEDACNAVGMSLCSTEQLFRVVFSSVDGYAGGNSYPSLCRSGWMSSDYQGDQIGFFHSGPDGSCGDAQPGWHGWNPEGFGGAHCCAAFTGSTVQQCGSSYSGCGEGTLVNSDGWCGDLTGCDNDVCCTPWTAAPLYAVQPSQYANVFTTPEEADDACRNYHEDMRLCTADQLVGLAKDYNDLGADGFDSSDYYGNQMCSLGWYRTAAGENPSATIGLYLDEAFAGDKSDSYGCGQSPGFSAWIPTDSQGQQVGSAHCCVPSYVKSGYNGLDEVSFAGAQSYCSNLPYPKEVCTKYQLRTIVDQEDASPCMAGYLRETTDDSTGISGWWQGDAGDIGGCGNDFTWNDEGGWADTSRGAHCCETYVLQATTPAYYYGTWGQLYSSQDDAAAQCSSGYSLCSAAQVQKVATDGVVLDDGETLQVEPGICRFGWTSEGTIGWYQGTADENCGAAVGWHGTDEGSHTFHCCTDFEGAVVAVTAEPTEVVTEAPTMGECVYGDVKIVDSIGYIFLDNTGFVPICAHYFANGYMWGGDQVCQKLGYNGASVTEASGTVADETAFFVGDCWEQVFPECTDQWDECAGDLAMTTRFECDGAVVDNRASCILPDTTAPPETTEPVTLSPTEPTDEPTTTEEPTTPVQTSSEPTEPVQTSSEPTEPTSTDVGDLPSSVAPPSDCVGISFVPEGFDGHVSYCVSSDVVYLNGLSTCILSTTDNLDVALQNSWNNDWYLAASTDCSGKDYDTATDDQLFITNEMCNNLEDDIDELETSVDGLNTYMDEWTQSVIELVNGQIHNFDQPTQDALNDYLATLT